MQTKQQAHSIEVIGSNFNLENLCWIVTQNPETAYLIDEADATHEKEIPLSNGHWQLFVPGMKQGDHLGLICSRNGKKDLITEPININRTASDPVTFKEFIQAMYRGCCKRYADFDQELTDINKVVDIGLQDYVWTRQLWKDFLHNRITVGQMLGERVYFEGYLIPPAKRFSIMYNKEINLWVVPLGA